MQLRVISHLSNGFGWGACETLDSVKLDSSKFHSRTVTKLLLMISIWLVAHLQMGFEQVCGGACAGCEGFVLSVADLLQSELGYEMFSPLNR